MAKCTICKRNIVLIPSAAERARKYGESPAYYTALFTVHAQCALDKRAADTVALMRRIHVLAQQ